MTNTRLRTPQLSRRSFCSSPGWICGATLGHDCRVPALPGKPTGHPGARAQPLAHVSLDNKLNQFDAAVTAQRGVRQGLTRIGDNLTPQLVLADRFESTGPTEWTVRLREGIRYSDGTPVLIDDVTTAMQMYQQVSGSFVAPQFPEWPTVVPIDDRTFILRTNSRCRFWTRSCPTS
ncbi:ABC transporter substrate-binding protein [Rhodococcus sp. 3Y1]